MRYSNERRLQRPCAHALFLSLSPKTSFGVCPHKGNHRSRDISICHFPCISPSSFVRTLLCLTLTSTSEKHTPSTLFTTHTNINPPNPHTSQQQKQCVVSSPPPPAPPQPSPPAPSAHTPLASPPRSSTTPPPAAPTTKKSSTTTPPRATSAPCPKPTPPSARVSSARPPAATS